VVIKNPYHSAQQELVKAWDTKLETSGTSDTGLLAIPVTLLPRYRTSSQQQRNMPHQIPIKHESPNYASSPKAK
jgi:hypothetical protein